jgi:formylglycine-generating enzyme required for sulfatase activity
MSQPKGCTAPPIVFLLFVTLFLGGGWLWGNWSGRKSNPANIDSSSNPLPIPLPLGDRLKIDDTELTLPSGVDYRPLRALLRQGKWREADEETRERLKEAAGATGQDLLPADVARIRCEDLAIVDRLWSSYSEQRFGLAVQWSVLEKAGMGTVYSEALWKTFGNRVGWRANSRWLEYEETRFERDAPPGHLPRLVFGEAGAVLPMLLEANAKQQCGTGVVSVPEGAVTSAPAQTSQPLAPAVSPVGLSRFRTQTVTLDRQGNIAERRTIEAEYFTESVNGVSIDMVAIPGGRFWMGSPENEAGRDSDEGPQREVSVAPFFMSKFEVTQAQWRAVAQLPQINRRLDPDPSHFKGDNRPVESVSWDEAQEFVARLSRATGKAYRLPSEAEWEYAARAGTTTPFAFGETLSSEVANYNGDYTYGNGQKGVDREETVDVGSFPPNAWGLYDLHGNVWEWNEDSYHDSYNGAPTDGTAWIDNSTENKLLRGGSWNGNPKSCRSAYRDDHTRDARINLIGFRLSLPRT